MDQERNGKNGSGGKTYIIDIVVWILWAILVWGFLGALAYFQSPKDTPGLHEIIILAYFLGFSSVFALIYIIAIKKGA